MGFCDFCGIYGKWYDGLEVKNKIGLFHCLYVLVSSLEKKMAVETLFIYLTFFFMLKSGNLSFCVRLKDLYLVHNFFSTFYLFQSYQHRRNCALVVHFY